jgi:chromosome segregation ATPase
MQNSFGDTLHAVVRSGTGGRDRDRASSPTLNRMTPRGAGAASVLTLEKDVTFLRNRCEMLDRQLDESKRQHRATRVECDLFQKELASSNRSMHAAHADREALSKKLDDAKEYTKKLEARLLVTAKMSALPKHQNHNDDLRDRLRSATATNDAISAEVQVLEARLSEVQAENETLRNALYLREDDLGFPVSQGKDIKQSLLYSLSATRQESRLLGLELAQRAASQHELQAQERMLSSQLRTYAERIQQLESDCDRYQDEHSRMKGMIGDLSAQVEDLRNERDYMLQYLKTEASKAEDLQEMLTKLQLEKIQLSKDSKDGGGRQKTDSSALQKQLSALLLEKEELSETLIIEHQKVSQLEQQLRQAKSAVGGGASAGMTVKIQSLNAEAEDREAVIGLLQAQLKQKSEECERLRSVVPVQPSDDLAQKAKISQLSEQVHELQQEKAQLLKVADELRARAASAIEVQKAQAEELEFLRADTNSLSRSKQELQHSLLDQINSLRKENLELRSRHDDLERVSKRGGGGFSSPPARSHLLNIASATVTPHSMLYSPSVRSEKMQVNITCVHVYGQLILSNSDAVVVQAVEGSEARLSTGAIKCGTLSAFDDLFFSHVFISTALSARSITTQPVKLTSNERSPAPLSARGAMQSPSELQRICSTSRPFTYATATEFSLAA